MSKVSEIMADVTPDPEYEGIATNDDFILAIKTEESQSTPGDYIVVQGGVTSHEATLNAESAESQYIRTGKVTTKTTTQRQFSVSGDRMEGDPFQNFVLSNKIKYGHGQSVVVDYVYFSMLTGKGEQGKVSIVVNEDQTGEAGENASFAVDLMGVGTPTDYTYVAS